MSRSSLAAISAVAASAKVPMVTSDSACTKSLRARLGRWKEAAHSRARAEEKEAGSEGGGKGGASATLCVGRARVEAEEAEEGEPGLPTASLGLLLPSAAAPSQGTRVAS